MKILAVSSQGGHFSELLKSLPNKKHLSVTFVTSKCKFTEDTLNSKPHYFIIDPHDSLLKYLLCLWQTIIVFWKIKPDVIISTGAGIALPSLFLGVILRYKVIFIETGARVKYKSRTGALVYKYCDLFIVQNKSQQGMYRNSQIGRL